MLLDINDIQKIIPHRYPFLLVDCVEEMEPGVRAVGYKNVTMNEPFFQGHFPQQPVMPGVLIIEALAQVGAIAVLSLPENKGKLAFFGGIKNAKFRKQVIPGDRLRLETKVTSEKGDVKEYKLVVTRLKEGETLGNNPDISELNIKGYDINFSKDKQVYSLKIEKRNSFVSRQDNVSHYSLSPIEFLFFYFNCIVRTYFCKRERRNMPTKRPNV